MTKISVLFYVYNYENFLNKTLDNLLKQSFHNFELICVDDGSTDGSLSIIKSYSKKDKRIKFISMEHRGFVNSINPVLDLCVGDYVYFLNPDAVLKFYALGFMYEQIEERKADFIFTDINYEYDNLFYNKSQSMNLISEINSNKVFSKNNLEDLIFGIDESLENKLFSLDFLRKKEITFSSHSPCPETHFFYEVLLLAEKIFYLKDFIFEFRKPLDSLALKNISLKSVYQIYEDIVFLFKNYGLYDEFKYNFYDLKISLLMKYYNKIKEEKKENYFNELRREFIEEFTSGKLNEKSIEGLSIFNRKVFEQILICESSYEFDLLRKCTVNNIEYNRLMDRKSYLKIVKNQSFDY